jgi:basic amino acid/polyamine antiporter, APA family
MAVSNSALINMIMASRIVYGMADQGIVSGVFGRVLPGRRTPIVAIAFTTVVAVILISTGDLESLADTTVLLLLSVFTIVNISVLVLRREEVEHDHFHAPALFPVLGAIVSIGLIVDAAIDDLATFGRAGALLALGALLWFVNRLAER